MESGRKLGQNNSEVISLASGMDYMTLTSVQTVLNYVL